MRERWGTFSVRDHVSDAPLVSDVLLYDRLILPVPDSTRSLEEQEWKKAWRPDLLEKCLSVLGVKTEQTEGLALTVPWTSDKRERFKSRMSTAAALARQRREPESTYYEDPFHLTRELIRDEFRPALPKGVSKAWTVAAYTSATAFKEDLPAERRREQIAALVKQRFVTPAGPDPDQELLKRCVELATTDSFIRKRQAYYAWQENIIEEQISDKKAIEELDALLDKYNKATSSAFKDVLVKYVFTVVPIGIAVGGALISGGTAPMVLAAASGFVGLTRFWVFDRKPVIKEGDLDPAAMLHDISDVLDLG